MIRCPAGDFETCVVSPWFLLHNTEYPNFRPRGLTCAIDHMLHDCWDKDLYQSSLDAHRMAQKTFASKSISNKHGLGHIAGNGVGRNRQQQGVPDYPGHVQPAQAIKETRLLLEQVLLEPLCDFCCTKTRELDSSCP